MNKSEAVSFLRRYRKDVRINPCYVPWRANDYAVRKYVYMRYLIDLLIRRIKESEDNPVSVVRKAYWKNDMFMQDSDNPYTLNFLKIISECLGDILVDLDYEDEKQKHYFSGENIVTRFLGIDDKGAKNEEA